MADAKNRASSSTFGWSGFAVRWAAALVLVLLTYNPVGFSYFDWVKSFADTSNLPLKLLAGLFLLTGYIIYLRATAGSLGKLGSIIFVAIFGVTMWLLFDKFGDSLKDATVLTWIILFALSIYLALGMTASFLWKRLTGQVDMAESDIPDHHN